LGHGFTGPHVAGHFHRGAVLQPYGGYYDSYPCNPYEYTYPYSSCCDLNGIC
jgi:hypothetical protein